MIDYSLSVIIPAYNEENDIVESVQANITTLNEFNINYEIIIVNDGSTDNSLSLVESVFFNNKNVKTVSKTQNQGFGSAVKTGIQYCRKTHIIVVPVDSPLSINIYKCFHSHIGDADILVSYRKERKGYSLRMRFNSVFFHFLISNLFKLKLKDYNWIHLYSNIIFQEQKIEIKSNGIFMLAEILIKSFWAKYTFFEFPVDHSERQNGIPTAASYNVALVTAYDTIIFYIKYLIKGPFFK